MTFNLSEKMYFVGEVKPLFEYDPGEEIPLHLKVKDVKKFIKELKKAFNNSPYKENYQLTAAIHSRIDRLAGSKLIEGGNNNGNTKTEQVC